MRVLSSILIIVSILFGQNREVSFMRFYANDHDFMADDRLLATDRFQKSHLQVFYNAKKMAVMKEWIDMDGESLKREVLEYDPGKKLIRRYFLNADQKPDSLIQYGMEEPWSEEFRKESPKQIQGYYEGQESKFILNESDQIESIHFTDIRGDHYGKIDFIYDHLGLLSGEVWISLPTENPIR